MADTDVFDLSKSFMKVMKTNPACFTKVLLDDEANFTQLKENGLTIGDPGDLPATTTKSESIQTFKSFISNVLSEGAEDAGGPFDARAYHNWIVDDIKGNKEFFGSEFTDPEFKKLQGVVVDENMKETSQSLVDGKGLDGAEIITGALVGIPHNEITPVIKIWINAIMEATDAAKDLGSKIRNRVNGFLHRLISKAKSSSVKEYCMHIVNNILSDRGERWKASEKQTTPEEEAKKKEKIGVANSIFGFTPSDKTQTESYTSFSEFLKKG